MINIREEKENEQVMVRRNWKRQGIVLMLPGKMISRASFFNSIIHYSSKKKGAWKCPY
jgi:hypothetical protein